MQKQRKRPPRKAADEDRERIKTVRGLSVYKRTDPRLRALQGNYAPSIHGGKIWGSSYLIMDYLDVVPPPRRPKVLEIGCGWGLLGIWCARFLGAEVRAIDADDKVFPFLRLHAERNRVRVRTRQLRYEKIPPRLLQGQDLVAGGDICFWDELVNPLYRLIDRAMEREVGSILIADPGRPPFLKLAKRCRKRFGADLLPYSVTDPLDYDGYVLAIHNR